jgi:Flp pilus assembly protein TadD
MARALTLLPVFCFVPTVATTQDLSERAQSVIRASPADGPLHAPVYFTRRHENDEGVGRYRDGDWDLAAHHFRRALMSDPSMAEAHFNLALAFVQLRKHRDATKEFESAIELAPSNPQIAEVTVLRQYLGRSEGNRYDGLP